MVNSSTRHSEIDALRGFALCGVLFSNFNSYTSQQVPPEILDQTVGLTDDWFQQFNALFLEWKFMALFSILFGCGFGILYKSLSDRYRHPESIYLRRLFILFLLGILHLSFWWFDVLHLYAVCGVMLLLFKDMKMTIILPLSFLFMFPLPFAIGFYLKQFPPGISDADVRWMYEQFKYGSLADLVRCNWEGYYKLFVKTGSNYRDIPETLGRFLFGYWLVLGGWERKSEWIRAHAVKIILPLLIISALYFQFLLGTINLEAWTASLLYRSGIFCTTCLYAILFLLAFGKFGNTWFFRALTSMGKMTLTLYLLVSACMIALLYGIGGGYLGEVTITQLFLLASLTLMTFILIAPFWLQRFYFGPLEWLWKMGTYMRYIALKRSR
jgi:uncharacterized protein